MSWTIFFYFITIYKVTYMNETEWNLMKKKIDTRTHSEKDIKLCYYFNIDCKKLFD